MPMNTIIERSMPESLRSPSAVPLCVVLHEVISAAIVSHHEDGVARSILEHLQGPKARPSSVLVLAGASSPATEAEGVPPRPGTPVREAAEARQ